MQEESVRGVAHRCLAPLRRRRREATKYPSHPGRSPRRPTSLPMYEKGCGRGRWAQGMSRRYRVEGAPRPRARPSGRAGPPTSGGAGQDYSPPRTSRRTRAAGGGQGDENERPRPRGPSLLHLYNLVRLAVQARFRPVRQRDKLDLGGLAQAEEATRAYPTRGSSRRPAPPAAACGRQGGRPTPAPDGSRPTRLRRRCSPRRGSAGGRGGLRSARPRSRRRRRCRNRRPRRRAHQKVTDGVDPAQRAGVRRTSTRSSSASSSTTRRPRPGR